MSRLNHIWYQRNLIFYSLIPFSLIYCLISRIRRFCYQIHLKKTVKLPVPIIIVGNLTVGGTGKTPLVIWLTELLKQQGFKPGVISRGYGGNAKLFPQWVTADSDPIQVGDEPVLIARRTQCPLVVAPDRLLAAKTLLAKTPCNLIISDDGLQHYRLGRKIEIVVIDGTRRFGNGFCLPAGPLREPLTRLRTVDFIVANGNARPDEYSVQLVPDKLYNLVEPQRLLAVEQIQQKVHAIAGIGNPERFFSQLRALGLTIIAHPFPDHHYFKAADIDFGQDALIIMTEKDAVKCAKFADNRHWCLPVSAKVDALFTQSLLEKLNLPLAC